MTLTTLGTFVVGKAYSNTNYGVYTFIGKRNGKQSSF